MVFFHTHKKQVMVLTSFSTFLCRFDVNQTQPKTRSTFGLCKKKLNWPLTPLDGSVIHCSQSTPDNPEPQLRSQTQLETSYHGPWLETRPSRF